MIGCLFVFVLKQRVQQISDTDDDTNDNKDSKHAKAHIFQILNEVLRVKGETAVERGNIIQQSDTKRGKKGL